jgi:uncharacterized protein
VITNNRGTMLEGNSLPVRNSMIPPNLVNNEVTSRRELLRSLLDPRRDVNYECGYPETETITVSDYRQMFEREAIATRVVELEPVEAWQIKPCVYESEDEDTETPFELSWKHVCDAFDENSWFRPEEKTHPCWDYLQRVDILSGVGHFGCLLIGIDDGKDLSEPVAGFKDSDTTMNLAADKLPPGTPVVDMSALKEAEPDDEEDEDEEEGESDDKMTEAPKTKHKLIYLRAFDEHLIEINRYESDQTNPRYGQPIEYTLTINDPLNNSQTGIGIVTQTVKVHWSRVLHVADNLGSSEIFGTPRQRPVWNRLLDTRKIFASSGEGYWQGAFPGISLETHPQLGGDVTVDVTNTRKQMYDYTNSMQRYIALSGMSAKTLSAQIVDPNPQLNACIDAICIKLGCPKRIFMGSERGELASSEDKDTWETRLQERREGYMTQRIIVPFINRLIQLKVLIEPKDGYCVDWEQPDEQSASDKATIAKTITDALVAYVSGGVDALMSPSDYLIKVIGLPEEEVETILEAAVEHVNEANPDLDDVTVPGQHPEPPPPEEPMVPIKVREGEKLVDPTGKPLTGKQPPQLATNQGAKLETMGECLATLNALYSMSIPTDPVLRYRLADRIQEVELITNKFISPAQRRWWFATLGSGTGGSAKIKGMPESPKGLKHIQNLGGSTGATLVQDADGNKFVMKKGASPDHLRSEYKAENAYRAAGARVPTSHLYETENGPVKLSKFVEGTEYGKLTGAAKETAKKELQKHFAADAALGNWDAIGAGGDNILVDKRGRVHRIDVGGSLEYRAQGEKKTSSQWTGDSVSELNTMRDVNTNYHASSVFGSMSPQEILNSAKDLAARKDLVMKQLSPKDAEIVGKRIDLLSGNSTPTPKPTPTPPKPVVTTTPSVTPSVPNASGTSHLVSGTSLATHVAASGQGKFTKMQLEKLAFLNPDGIKNNTILVPKIANKATQDQFLKSLPAGVTVKIVDAKQNWLDKGAVPTGVKASTVKTGPKPTPAPTAASATPVMKSPPLDPGYAAYTYKVADFSKPEFKMAAKKWANDLPYDQKQAVSSWVGSSTTIRKATAGNPPPPPKLDPTKTYPPEHKHAIEKSAEFYKAIVKAPKVEGQVFRGLSGPGADKVFEQVQAAGIGGIWSDAAPHSMSRNISTATSFSGYGSGKHSGGDTMLRIQTKTGRSIEILNSLDEQEVVGMPGVQYRIKAIKLGSKATNTSVKTYDRVIELEEIE